MNKLETAKQLARQTIEQEAFTEPSPQQRQQRKTTTDTEIMDFVQAVQKVLNITAANQQQLTRMEEKINQAKKDQQNIKTMLIALTVLITIILTISILK